MPADLQALIFLLHHRDSIFSQQLDQYIYHFGLRILTMPPQSPRAYALCERLIGTLRQECLDDLSRLSARHVRRVLTQWVCHDNEGRPHIHVAFSSLRAESHTVRGERSPYDQAELSHRAHC
jgi:transposase InsO family protein